MKLKLLLVVLLGYVFSLGVYADDAKKISFDLETIKLTKNIWGEGDANLKVLILYENSFGSTSVLNVGKDIQAPLYDEIKINSGVTVPIGSSRIAEVSIVIMHETSNGELASLVLNAIGNITNRKAIKELNKISKENWLSLVVSEALDISTDFVRDAIVEYIKENEICRMIIQIEKGDNNWSHNRRKADENGNVRISYRTNFVGYKEESLLDKGVSFLEEGVSSVKQIFQHDSVVVNNLMWQDEPYTEDEVKAYKDTENYGKMHHHSPIPAKSVISLHSSSEIPLSSLN